jgi:hypothetical protein
MFGLVQQGIALRIWDIVEAICQHGAKTELSERPIPLSIFLCQGAKCRSVTSLRVSFGIFAAERISKTHQCPRVELPL